MPTINVNRKVFEKLVGKTLPENELKERISMLGTDLESVDENEIQVEIFPNRPDMLSEQGFARAFSSFIGVKTGLRNYEVKQSGEKVIIDSSVNQIRPFTVCAIVKNLKFDDEKIREIIQIQEKLHVTFCRNRKKGAIGIYPMEKIKMPIKYMAKNPNEIKFIPLEFNREMTGLQVLSQHPTGREYGHLLEGLEKFPVFIDADENVLSIPPIINSHMTGKINEETTNVFIECSGFEFHTLSICLNIIVTALADMGGEVFSMDLEYPDGKKVTPNLSPRKMEFDLAYCNKILGLDLNLNEAIKLLEKMGYGFENPNTVLIPAYRADVLHIIDPIEDIAIAFGYENFQEEIPNVSTVGQEDELEIFKRKVSQILIGLGLLEINTYHLSNNEEQNQKMGFETDDLNIEQNKEENNEEPKKSRIKVVELTNALTQDYSILRAWMLPSSLNVLSNNKTCDYPQHIFEIGNVFNHSNTTETFVKEHDSLSICLCGPDVDFTKIKQILDTFMRALDTNYETDPTNHNSFIPGRVANIIQSSDPKHNEHKQQIGFIGELSPQVLENWELNMPVACFELNISQLFKLLNNI